MSDLFDRASDREAELLAEALYEQQQRSGLAGKTISDSAHECVDCEEQIPELRRAAVPGVQRCVGCEELAERARRER